MARPGRRRLVAVAKAFYSPAASAALPNVVDAGGSVRRQRGRRQRLGHDDGGRLVARRRAERGVQPVHVLLITAGFLAAAAVLTVGVRRPMQAPRDAGVRARRTRSRALREAVALHPAPARGCRAGHGQVGGRLRQRRAGPVPGAGRAPCSRVGSIGTGLLFAARGAGALVGPLLLRRVLRHRTWLLPGLAISMAVYGLSYLGVSLGPWFPLALVLVVVAHMAGGGNWMMSSLRAADRGAGRAARPGLRRST